MKNIKEEKRKKGYYNRKFDLILFLLFCFCIVTLTVGHSILSKDLNISAEASVRPVKDIRITNISLSEVTNNGQSNYENYSADNINVSVTLPNTNSQVTYEVDISNIGSEAMIIKSISPVYGENTNIEYVIDGIEVGKTIINTNITTPTKIKVTVKYKDNVTITNTNANLKLIFKFDVVSPILTVGSRGINGEVFDNGNITKDKIGTIKFESSINVPDGAVSWDASYNKDNSVIAYYTVNSETSLYDLVICANGKVEFYEDSNSLFSNYSNMTKIDFNNSIDTSNVVNMEGFFGRVRL